MYRLFLTLSLIFPILSCQNQQAQEKEATDVTEVSHEERIEDAKEADSFLMKENKNIEEYYLHLPSGDYFNCEFERLPDIEFRSKHIVIKDIKNGYLLATDSLDFILEMALFKDRESNRDIIGVFSRSCNIGGQCPPTYDFWTVENGKWNKITGQVFNEEETTRILEKKTGEEVGYKLPRQGTKIEVLLCEEGTSAGSYLSFLNGKFVLD